MSLDGQPDSVRYASVRSEGEARVEFHASYGPTSAPYEAGLGTLEHWLTERYCLYARAANGTLYRTEVHHHPWPLQRAEVEITQNDLLAPHGLSVYGPPPVLHFARRLDVVVWSPEAVACT